ncbi:MAG: helix-turn-helix domain-containing protein [Coriobacteriaceae bacterium]|jgi:hypothetical protein|nr:helix-turn-helix domain-containing protein [Coriobacteriaceae bacterium]
MEPQEIEALYMTRDEVIDFLGVTHQRVYALKKSGFIKELKGGVYDRSSVEAYKAKRGDRKGGRYPAGQGGTPNSQEGGQ